MARRISGLSGSKLPIRGLTQLLKNLSPADQNRLLSAFADAENLGNFHSRSNIDRIARRKISGRIETITLKVENNLLGAFLSWDRVDDPRIGLYEIQISNDNVFSAPETFPVHETFFILENLRSTKFARVRAVNAVGETGLFSNTVTIRPRISAPEARTVNFYQGYETNAEPKLKKKLHYSGGVDTAETHAQFYTVLEDSFYIDNIIGGASIWGYISSRLKNYRSQGDTPWDRVRFKVNGITRMDGYFPMWTTTYTETNFHANERDSDGNLMTFYSRGGYTASFGPYAVTLPNLIAGEGPNDAFEVIRREAADGTFYWRDPQNAAAASRFDQAQLETFDVDLAAHEAASYAIDEGQKTEWLVFRDFRFKIPSDATITGIEAKIKRRQVSPFNDPIPKDNGFAVPNLPFENISVFKNTDIQVNSGSPFGRFLNNEFDGNDRTLKTEDPFNISEFQPLGLTGESFTVAMWVNNYDLVVPSGVPPVGIFSMRDDGIGLNLSSLLIRRNGGGNSDQLRIDFTRQGAGTNIININNFFITSSKFIHLAITWNGADLRTFKNGATVNITGPAGSAKFNGTGNFGVEVLDIVGVGRPLKGGICQVAIWDGVISDIQDIAENRSGIQEIAENDLTMDLRFGSGNYQDQDKLLHYWLFFPDQADIRDDSVHLIDETNSIRTDLNNKAITDESWPKLSQFFYNDTRQFGFLPLALSDGIPHDNHTAIGYQDYGGQFDLWGASSWTPSQVNDFYFGLALRAKNEPLNGFRGSAFVDHAKLTVYTAPESSRDIEVEAEVATSNLFYVQREVFGGLMNIISLGERLAEIEDC